MCLGQIKKKTINFDVLLRGSSTQKVSPARNAKPVKKVKITLRKKLNKSSSTFEFVHKGSASLMNSSTSKGQIFIN